MPTLPGPAQCPHPTTRKTLVGATALCGACARAQGATALRYCDGCGHKAARLVQENGRLYCDHGRARRARADAARDRAFAAELAARGRFY
jgi:hypothetical protein